MIRACPSCLLVSPAQLCKSIAAWGKRDDYKAPRCVKEAAPAPNSFALKCSLFARSPLRVHANHVRRSRPRLQGHKGDHFAAARLHRLLHRAQSSEQRFLLRHRAVQMSANRLSPYVYAVCCGARPGPTDCVFGLCPGGEKREAQEKPIISTARSRQFRALDLCSPSYRSLCLRRAIDIYRSPVLASLPGPVSVADAADRGESNER